MIYQTTSFKNQFKDTSKRYQQSINDISNDIKQLPQDRDVSYPGFGQQSVFKHEIGLEKYRLSASKGLRIVYMKSDKHIVLITVYTHHDDIKESDVIRRIRQSMIDINNNDISVFS